MPERIGQPRAEDLLYSGRSVSGDQAAKIGLVDALDDAPESAALAWFDQALGSKSASSLRLALRAARLGYVQRMTEKLEAVERLYLNELMATHDAIEGLDAFIAKRPAKWENA